MCFDFREAFGEVFENFGIVHELGFVVRCWQICLEKLVDLANEALKTAESRDVTLWHPFRVRVFFYVNRGWRAVGRR